MAPFKLTTMSRVVKDKAQGWLKRLVNRGELTIVSSEVKDVKEAGFNQSAPSDCLTNNEGPPHLPPDGYDRRVSQTWKASSP